MKNEMGKTGHKTTVNPLYIYSFIAAAFIYVGSLPFIGWSPLFAYGLVLGTAIAIVNYNLLVITSKSALEKGRGISLIIIGYAARMAIYGGVFLISYKAGTVSGIGTLLGYLTLKLGMFYKYGFKPGFKSKKYKENQLRDLDEDPWAIEQLQKEEEKAEKKGIFKAFKWEDDTKDKE